MISSYSREYGIILFSFLIALLLQIIPWPDNISIFRPNWVLLMLFFWILSLPCKINFGMSFIIGIVLDLINGSILGIHALAVNTITYIFLLKYKSFRNQILWQQALAIMFMLVFLDLIIFWENFLITGVSFQIESLWSSVISGVLWPWLFLLMCNIRQHFIA